MATFVEEYAKSENISVEEAHQTVRGWLNYKSNKDHWCEEQEEMEE